MTLVGKRGVRAASIRATPKIRFATAVGNSFAQTRYGVSKNPAKTHGVTNHPHRHSCYNKCEWLPLYVERLIQHLQADLHELCGCVLVCDCPPEATCEADVLAGLVFEECRAAPPQRELTSGDAGGRACWVLVNLQSFVSLYPANFFVAFRFPMIEDLINSPPFTCFGRWLRNQELSWDGSLGPAHSTLISV